MKRKIIPFVCVIIASLAFAPTTTSAKTTNKANPMETQAPTPAREVLTVTTFTPGESIGLQSSALTQAVTYELAKKVRYVDSRGKTVSSKTIRPGTRVRVTMTGKRKHEKVGRVVVIQAE
jgi:uncharacterized protein YfaS (alpha-2-macroglobulin family)